MFEVSSDCLSHSIKIVARFFFGIAIGSVAILGFAVVSGAIPASELTLENVSGVVAGIRAKADLVKSFWEDPSAVRLAASVYGFGEEIYAGPNIAEEDDEEEADDCGDLDSWDGFNEYIARDRSGR